MLGSADISQLLFRFRIGLEDILGEKLHGIYVYGAVTFPETIHTGDIDFHVILVEPLTESERRSLEAFHELLGDEFPPLGKEMDGYYILLEDAQKRLPPQSQLWKKAVDKAWALHRAHIRAGRCIVVYGPPGRELYPAASWVELESALRDELDYVRRHLQIYPAYCVLNLCRLIYSFQSRDVVISKTAAAAWAESKYPQWRGLIKAANRSYEGRASEEDRQFMAARIGDWYKFALDQFDIQGEEG